MSGRENRESKEYKVTERSLRLKMLLEVKKEVTLLIFSPDPMQSPLRLTLKKGTRVTLLGDEPASCATTERVAIGLSVRIDVNQKVDIENRFLNKVVVVPAQHLRVHSQEL